YLLPEGAITNFDRYASLFDQPQDQWDSMNWFLPTDETDLFQTGGTWDYFDDVGYEPPSDEELLWQEFGPTVGEDELSIDYNSPTLGPFMLDEFDAAEGLDLLEDQ